MDAAVLARARRVALMIFDVDGVLTDGTIYLADDGQEMKAFNTLDGHGKKMLREAGVALAIISGRSARCVELRARELGVVHLWQGAKDKRAAYGEALERTGLAPEQTGYMGDDLPDLPLLARCGFSAAPAHAAEPVKRAAHYVSDAPGGRGAVREVCELILRAQGKLDAAIDGARQ
jgi:3-deoxy-D-manno-octulosonate 8-phosphate phosphatase (KDO 8-P phosphatase)